MIEEIGIVSEIKLKNNEQIIWVETQIKSTCGSCNAQSNCGTGAIAKAFVRKKETLRFELNEPVSLGQKIKLGIPEESLLKASFMVYLVPLCVLFLSALLSQSFLPFLGFQAEIWIVVFTFIGTFVSFIVIKAYLKIDGNEEFNPHIISILPLDNEVINVKQV